MDKIEQQLEELFQRIKNLPLEKRRAIYWFIHNIEFIEEILEQGSLPKEKLSDYLRAAEKEGDYYSQVILLYQKLRTEQMEQKEKK